MVSFKSLREELLLFYEKESKLEQKFHSVETHILWGLYYFVVYELEEPFNNQKKVKYIIQLIMSQLLSTKDEVWAATHDIIVSLAQSKLIKKMSSDTIRLIIRDISFKVLSLRIKGIQNPKAIVSLIFTLLEIIVEIPFEIFISNKEFSTLIFKMIAYARESQNESIRTAANILLSFTLNSLNNFPLISGSSIISNKNISEFDYLGNLKDVKSFTINPRIQHFILDDYCCKLISILEDPNDYSTIILIIRDPVGKFVWKIKQYYDTNNSKFIVGNGGEKGKGINGKRPPAIPKGRKEAPKKPSSSPISNGNDNKDENDGSECPLNNNKLKTAKIDMMEKLKNYISTNQYGIMESYKKQVIKSVELQNIINDLIIEEVNEQKEAEIEHFQKKLKENKFYGIKKPKRITYHGEEIKEEEDEEENENKEENNKEYHWARGFIENLGLNDEQNRRTKKLIRINKSNKFYRKIRHLDEKLFERETIKVGIIYVKNGQEDESSILNNSKGSSLFNEFIQSLGWEIDLSKHKGFNGGLDKKGKTTGESTYYWANATTELIFHISTIIPTKENDFVQIKKKRHIGNDWVHIVWSEHERDYRPWTISSKFNFVHIVIYPLQDPLFRIEVSKKPNVPLIGPLQQNMIIDKTKLSSLVRQTAINANKVVRFSQSNVKKCYVNRKLAIDEIKNTFGQKIDNVDGFYKHSLCLNPPENIKIIKKMQSINKTGNIDGKTPNSPTSLKGSKPTSFKTTRRLGIHSVAPGKIEPLRPYDSSSKTPKDSKDASSSSSKKKGGFFGVFGKKTSKKGSK